MVIFDPLYGEFVLPADLAGLALTPEVRRLSQIRLLNTLTPSLATLGELRRYSHTLGVLHLCKQNGAHGYSEEERRALGASVFLHDIGTPPFGHLFEYHLRELYGWSHEKVIRDVLYGSHLPENKAHQIFGLRSIEFRPTLKRLGISLDLVAQIVTNKHPLAHLLFGTLDLDNLDNIARMSHSLGLRGGPELATNIASGLRVSNDSKLILSQHKFRTAVQAWLGLRKNVYNIVGFDPWTVGAQASLSEAIGIAIRNHEISEQDWALTDEQLIERLLKNDSTKNIISREYLGRLVAMAFVVRLTGGLNDYGLPDRTTAKKRIEEALHEEFAKERILGYTFVDHGTFEKRLTFLDSDTRGTWGIGSVSESILLYGFVRSSNPLSLSRCRRAANALVSSLHASQAQIIDFRVRPDTRPTDEYQQSFAVPSA
jgi:HD superfamily phosphohydrolase